MAELVYKNRRTCTRRAAAILSRHKAVQMASGLAILLAAFLLVVSVGAQQQGSGCSTQLSLLAPCLPFVQGSGGSRPTSDCCNKLGVVLDNNPLCLCAVVAGPGVPINSTLALLLPVRCNMKNVPDASRCNAGAPSSNSSQQQARQQRSPSPAPSLPPASPKSSGRLAPAPALSSPEVARAPAPVVATAPAMAAPQDVPAASPGSSSSQPFLPVTAPAPGAAATSAATFEAVSASSLLLGLLWSLF